MISKNLNSKIYAIRNTQVMLDEDLALLYGVLTKRLNEQVRRNKDRFPEKFCFQLTKNEYDHLQSKFTTSNTISRSQIATLKISRGQHRKYLPYAFTEQGVAMLSAVLKSKTAITVSIQIMQAFVSMRKLLIVNAGIFQRLEHVEQEQISTNKNVQKILTALDDKTIQPKQGIFFDGQIFDAYRFARKIVKSAKSSIILIDNYINEDTLHIFSDCKSGVTCDIYTSRITKKLELDLAKYNEQNQPITIHQFDKSHDRFLIIDQQDIYHFGASLKDLGKKWFGFGKMSTRAMDMLSKLA